MGGTFDPIHLGHLVVAAEALHEFALDRVLFVPAARPWQKMSYADAEDRFLMTTLAASSHPRFAVSRLELDRQGPTYTVETMSTLKDFHGDDVSLFFIIGADAFLKLGTWHRIEGLAEVAELIAVARPGYDLDRFAPEPGWPRVHLLRVPGVEVSSSDIRARVRAGRSIDYLVTAEVATHIRSQGLYVAGGGATPGS